MVESGVSEYLFGARQMQATCLVFLYSALFIMHSCHLTSLFGLQKNYKTLKIFERMFSLLASMFAQQREKKKCAQKIVGTKEQQNHKSKETQDMVKEKVNTRPSTSANLNKQYRH